MNKLIMAVAVAGVLAFAVGCEWKGGAGASTWTDGEVAIDFSGVYVAAGSYVIIEPGSAVSNSIMGERMTYGNGGNSYAGTLAHSPLPGSMVVRAGDIVLHDDGSGALIMSTNASSGTATNTMTEHIATVTNASGGTYSMTEQIGLGDGDKTAFSGTLKYAPEAGTLTITVGGYVFTDAGGSDLTCSIADGAYGTFNRITMKWTLSFPAPISAGTPLVATYIFGSGFSSSYSGSLKHAPLANTVTITAGFYVFTDNGSDALTCNIADGSSANVNHQTGYWSIILVAPPDDGTPITAAYNYAETSGDGGNASGTISYSSGTWTLSFSEPLSGSAKVLADYMYVTGLQQGNHGNGIFSLTVTPMGTSIRITDNNGSVYTGNMGVNSTVLDREAQFSATGVSQGYKVTMVGTLSASAETAGGRAARAIHGTYLEEDGYAATIAAYAE